MRTLALSTPDQAGGGWDLVIDSSGNLSVIDGGLALAQDVASAVRTFRGECWYDATLGVPYFQRVLGRRVSLQFLKQALVTAGLTVPGVASIACYLTGPGPNRAVGGQLQITSVSEQVSVAETGNLLGVLPWWVSAISEAAAETTVLTGGGVPLTGGGTQLTP